MIQTINKKKSPIKKVFKVLIVILVTPIVIVLLLIGLYFGTKPIFDKIDHDKFITLDTQMQKVYQELQTASNGTDVWKYKTVCSANHTGWMPTGTYNCVASISTQKNITTVGEINDLQSKYYPVVNSTVTLVPESNDLQFAGNFGKTFSVGLAYKDYTEKITGIGCTYEINIHQLDYRNSSEDLGSKIVGDTAKFFISLRCEETARSSWYQEVPNTSTVIPD